MGDTKSEAFLHGHSYTGHPVGCQVALTSLNIYENSPNLNSEKFTMTTFWNNSMILKLSKLDCVSGCFAIGTVLVIQLKTNESGYASNIASPIIENLFEEGIFCRPLVINFYLKIIIHHYSININIRGMLSI